MHACANYGLKVLRKAMKYSSTFVHKPKEDLPFNSGSFHENLAAEINLVMALKYVSLIVTT
jgi:hypothetical protein